MMRITSSISNFSEQPHGADGRIGLIALSTDLAVESDLHRLARATGRDVEIFTTRIPLVTPNTVESFAALAERLPETARTLVPESELNAIVFGCTAASTIIGVDGVNAALAAGRPGIPATNPASAVLCAFRTLRATRVAMATPYTHPVTERTARWFEKQGVTFTSITDFGSDNDDVHARISASDWVAAIDTLDVASADAIFLSCTATRAIEAIESIEARYDKPVVTSNQATFWHACAIAGRRHAPRTYGRLFAHEALR